MLQQYAAVFDTVELNSSFYRPPEAGAILGLMKYTKRGFMFAAKVNRQFTHDLKLKLDAPDQERLENFLQLFDPLLTQDRLACFLVQLPPSLKRCESLLENFLAMLPHRYDYVVEFRHTSWMNDRTWKILAKYETAYCIVDEPLLTPELHVTSPISYIRWHGRGKGLWYDYRYTREELQQWVPRINEVSKNSGKTFGIFNNHFHGYAIENCLQMMKMLNIATSTQERALNRVTAAIDRELLGLPKTGTLDQFAREP